MHDSEKNNLDETCLKEHHHDNHTDDCCCGEHEHQHDHEHHHNEHHHHDEDCCCGEHHHDHEHHHDEDCCCGENDIVEVHTHDGATVGSGKKTFVGSYDEIETVVSKEIENLSKWIEENNGIIGHIKAFLECVGPCSMISATDAESNAQIKRNTDIKVQVNLAAIVFNIKPADLKTKLTSVLENLDVNA